MQTEVNLTLMGMGPPGELGGSGDRGVHSASEKTHSSPYHGGGSREEGRGLGREKRDHQFRRKQHRGRPEDPSPGAHLPPPWRDTWLLVPPT